MDKSLEQITRWMEDGKVLLVKQGGKFTVDLFKVPVEMLVALSEAIGQAVIEHAMPENKDQGQLPF